MKIGPRWQKIAERLAESGWSWQHTELTDRVGRDVHVVEAHNDHGQTHAAVAASVGPGFVAVESSIKAAGN